MDNCIMLITLSVLAIAIILFVTEKVRSDLVALCALLVLMVCNILTPAEALSGFSSSIIMMM
jgi:di/tricarboxylate transporter